MRRHPLPNPILGWIGLGTGLASVIYAKAPWCYYKPAGYSPADIPRSVQHALQIVDRWSADLSTAYPHESFRGQDVLELGPGQSLGTGLVLLARGAATYTAADIQPLAYRSPTVLYQALANVLEVAPSLAKTASYQLVNDSSLSPLTGTYHFGLSNSTLEHIDDVSSTFVALRRLVRGVMIHHVDARVHQWFRDMDPLNHLRHGKWIYQLMRYPAIPNRLLANDYVELARSVGFEEVRIIPHLEAGAHYVERVRPGLAKPFQTRPDLSLLTFTLVAR